jgi:hypothetical protein
LQSQQEHEWKAQFIRIHEKYLKLVATKLKTKQTLMLAIPTIGFPATMAAMSWVEDLL